MPDVKLPPDVTLRSSPPDADPAYRYFETTDARGRRHLFCYTTGRAEPNRARRAWKALRVGYLVLAFREQARGFVLYRQASRQQRWRARDAAYKWYCALAGRAYESLHAPRVLPEAARERLRAHQLPVEQARARAAHRRRKRRG